MIWTFSKRYLNLVHSVLQLFVEKTQSNQINQTDCFEVKLFAQT